MSENFSNKTYTLTEEQKALIPAYREEFIKIALDTTPTDRRLAEESVLKTYDVTKTPRPTNIVWEENPFSATVRATKIKLGKDDVTIDEIRQTANDATFGSFEAYWVCYFAFPQDVIPDFPKQPLVDAAKEMIKHCGVYYTLENGTLVLSPKPVMIKTNNAGEIHCEDGPAIRYADGTEVYALNSNFKKSFAHMMMERISGGNQ